MKKFVRQLLIYSLLFFLLAEVAVRIFGFAGHTVPNTYIDGEYRLKPGSKGTWVKGTSGEIKSQYAINKEGFNSVIDYSTNDTTKNYIAIIGDSYIEGLHSNVDSSIGRKIEGLLPNHQLEIHEYGISGWNAWNYLEITNLIHDNYDLIYVLITDKDLIGGIPSKANITSESIFRVIYNSSHFIRYLNINRGMLKSLQNIGPKSIIKSVDNTEKIPEYNLLYLFPKNCIFLYELDKFKFPNEDIYSISIVHKIRPINFGKQDTHWNDNGRLNCANTIAKSIEKIFPLKKIVNS